MRYSLFDQTPNLPFSFGPWASFCTIWPQRVSGPATSLSSVHHYCHQLFLAAFGAMAVQHMGEDPGPFEQGNPSTLVQEALASGY